MVRATPLLKIGGHMATRPTKSKTTTDAASKIDGAELACHISDLDARILRQQKRIDRILISGQGPATEMQTVLDDMLRSRASMTARLNRVEPARPPKRR